MTDFSNEIVHALEHGGSHAELRQIVLCHKANGLSQRAAYEALEKI